MTWDGEFDLISVGSGAGGLAAAVTAGAAGSSVLVLEKDSLLGGVTACGQAEFWVGANHLETANDVADSEEETLAYAEFLSVGLGDEGLRRVFVDRAAEACEFLDREADLQLRMITDRPDWYFPDGPGSKAEGRYLEAAPVPEAALGDLAPLIAGSAHGFDRFTQQELFDAAGDTEALAAKIAEHVEKGELCNGAALAARLLKAAVGLGATVKVESPAVALIRDGDAVVGVEAETPDGRVRLRAGAVVLATGGYDWNQELIRSFEHVSAVGSLVPNTVTGDHIALAGEVGGAIRARPPAVTPLIPGMHIPGQSHRGTPHYQFAFAGKPHSIYVNRAGERVGDESFYSDVDARLASIDGWRLSHPHWPTWMVFDQQFRDKYALGTILPGVGLPDGVGHQADTVAGLAELAGIDAAGLEGTLERFNGFCAEGVDHDFRRGERIWSVATFGDARMPKNPVLGNLEKPPFYAIELIRVGAGIPSAGLLVDAEARVVSTRGTAISGLYAAGNSAAQIDFIGYQSGISVARSLLQGYLAGRSLVGSAA